MNSPGFTESEARRRLESLQVELAARRSVDHFARSAVAMTVALILAGVAGKLFWDSSKVIGFSSAGGLLVSLVALGLAGYSVLRYFTGKRLLAEELERFESLKALRRALGIDDPSALIRP